jgi:hypothetical protein
METNPRLSPSVGEFAPLVDRSKPLHDWHWEQTQYKLKVQRYTSAPPEFTIQQRSFERDWVKYHNAYENGSSNAFPLRRRRVPVDGPRDAESIERSQRRAKSEIRRKVIELAPDHFTTFTTREAGPVYLSPSDWAEIWARFVRLIRDYGCDFEYVAVLERHPKNPQHLHLHVAWRGRAHYGVMRRLWHIAICAHRGLRITKTLRGEASPGNIQDQPVKAPRGSFKMYRRIAKYIAKYITKDLISEFNKKRYWPSKGINLSKAEEYWLHSLDQGHAIREALDMFGEWDHSVGDKGASPHSIFRPSDRVAWIAIDPASTPPPPF